MGGRWPTCKIFSVLPWAPEATVPSALWNGSSLSLLPVLPQCKPVHSRWLAPLCGIWLKLLLRVHSDIFYSSVKTVLFSRAGIRSASEFWIVILKRRYINLCNEWISAMNESVLHHIFFAPTVYSLCIHHSWVCMGRRWSRNLNTNFCSGVDLNLRTPLSWQSRANHSTNMHSLPCSCLWCKLVNCILYCNESFEFWGHLSVEKPEQPFVQIFVLHSCLLILWLMAFTCIWTGPLSDPQSPGQCLCLD